MCALELEIAFPPGEDWRNLLIWSAAFSSSRFNNWNKIDNNWTDYWLMSAWMFVWGLWTKNRDSSDPVSEKVWSKQRRSMASSQSFFEKTCIYKESFGDATQAGVIYVMDLLWRIQFRKLALDNLISIQAAVKKNLESKPKSSWTFLKLYKQDRLHCQRIRHGLEKSILWMRSQWVTGSIW